MVKLLNLAISILVLVGCSPDSSKEATLQDSVMVADNTESMTMPTIDRESASVQDTSQLNPHYDEARKLTQC